MTQWIRRPPDQPDQRWHLKALLPSVEPLLFAACGLQWTASRSYALEEVDDPWQIPPALRCEACEVIFVRQRREA